MLTPGGQESPWLNPESLLPKAPCVAPPSLPCPSLTLSFLVTRTPAELSPGQRGLCEGPRKAWGVVTLSPGGWMASLLPTTLGRPSLSLVEPLLGGKAWLWVEKFLLCRHCPHLSPGESLLTLRCVSQIGRCGVGVLCAWFLCCLAHAPF